MSDITVTVTDSPITVSVPSQGITTSVPVSTIDVDVTGGPGADGDPGSVTVADAAARTALGYGTSDEGKLVWQSDTDVLYAWDGTGWEQVHPEPDPEAWHYVGTSGEPAFQNGWANLGFGQSRLAFRRRGVGVDVVGFLSGSSATDPVICTLPVGYRPNNQSLVIGLASPDFAVTEAYNYVLTAAGLLAIALPTTALAAHALSGFFSLDSPSA